MYQVTAAHLAAAGLLASGDDIRGNGRRRTISATFAVGHKRPGNRQWSCTRTVDPAEGHPPQFRRWFWVHDPDQRS